MSHTKRLRELLAGPDTVVAPGMYDGLTGLMVEQAGFDCAYVGGASIAYSRLGRSDIGLTTCTEVADTISKIRDRIEIPFVVDADTGFGNALNTQRTMRMFERAGASGIQLEDQTMPKRCGHLDGKTLISTGEMTGKIKAALDARLDENTVIVGRTDAIAVEGFECALERAEAYALKIGAWCNEAPYNQLSLLVPPDEAKRIATAAPTRPKGQVELATLLANTVRLVDEKDGSQRLTLELEKEEGLEE